MTHACAETAGPRQLVEVWIVIVKCGTYRERILPIGEVSGLVRHPNIQGPMHTPVAASIMVICKQDIQLRVLIQLLLFGTRTAEATMIR